MAYGKKPIRPPQTLQPGPRLPTSPVLPALSAMHIREDTMHPLGKPSMTALSSAAIFCSSAFSNLWVMVGADGVFALESTVHDQTGGFLPPVFFGRVVLV